MLSTIHELKQRQDIQFQQARKKSQELERNHLVKAQARECKVLRARLQDEKQKLLVTKREAIELCIRRHQAHIGRTQQRNLKQKTKLQVPHPTAFQEQLIFLGQLCMQAWVKFVCCFLAVLHMFV